jgi:hypothetical protein
MDLPSAPLLIFLTACIKQSAVPSQFVRPDEPALALILFRNPRAAQPACEGKRDV